MTWIEKARNIARKLRQEKQKYHAKVLSDNAIFNNFIRTLDIEDLVAFYVWLQIPEFNYSSLAFSLLFDINPCETGSVDIDFNALLPEINEMLQGILVNFEKIDVCAEIDYLSDIIKYILDNIKEEYQEDLIKYRILKGRYDESLYGYSYYDPPAVREFMRKTFIKFFVERTNYHTIKNDLEDTAKQLNLNLEVAKYIFNRISQVINTQSQVFILGYGILGYSYLAEFKPTINYCKYDEGQYGECYYAPNRLSDLLDNGYAVSRFVNYDIDIQEFGLTSLDQVQKGFILGVTPLGYGYLLPRETIYKLVERKLSEIFTILGSPDVVRFIDEKSRRFINRLKYTAFAFANYQKPEERRDYRKSMRADQWMNLQLLRYMIENIVDPIIRKYESNPVKIRMYKSATLNLISGKAKRHTWGLEGVKALSEEEFKEWWLNHWSSYGLNKNVLLEIYEAIKPWLPQIRSLKLDLGRKVQEIRRRAAQLLK